MFLVVKNWDELLKNILSSPSVYCHCCYRWNNNCGSVGRWGHSITRFYFSAWLSPSNMYWLWGLWHQARPSWQPEDSGEYLLFYSEYFLFYFEPSPTHKGRSVSRMWRGARFRNRIFPGRKWSRVQSPWDAGIIPGVCAELVERDG